ncbi:MAG TPA: (d)CMP kinase [Galbitalea sp.]
MTDFVVAIDGPAGSGKSSVSRAAARVLGFLYLDTGAVYRAFAWLCLERGVDLANESSIAAELSEFGWAITTQPDDFSISVDSIDVTDAIREPRVSGAVSAIARVAAVRSQLTEVFQWTISADVGPGIIVEGRDITTVVAPSAQVRILLTASEQVRMGRRSAELSGEAAETTARHLATRDAQDSKVVDFMNAADGVLTVDSTDLDFDQTVNAVVTLVREAQPTD